MTVYQVLVVILIVLLTFIVGLLVGKHTNRPKESGTLHIVKDNATDIMEIYVSLDSEDFFKSTDKYVTMKVVRSNSQESQVV